MTPKPPQAQRLSLQTEDGIQLAAVYQPASGQPRGIVVLAHGITVDNSEDGMFPVLAQQLAERGYHSLRFDYRGHGQSQGTQEAMTVAGETLDFQAAFRHAQAIAPSVGVIASSFGAVSVCYYLQRHGGADYLILWNPVLDMRATFIDPQTPWAKESFSEVGFAHLRQHGYLLLDGSFKIGAELVADMKAQFQPFQALAQLAIPVLTLHGDHDTYVPYTVSQRHGAPNSLSEFVTIPGAEHGFGRQHERAFVIQRTVEWCIKHTPANATRESA